MSTEFDKTPSDAARPDPPPAPGADPAAAVNGLPPAPQAERLAPAPADRVAPGPPVPPREQVRAADAPLAATAARPAPEKAKDGPPEIKDGFREVIETIVFVVVLVLLLKAFLAEAFVIPTGSMATTLLGYHRDVKCPQCGYPYRINMSHQLDPDRLQERRLVS